MKYCRNCESGKDKSTRTGIAIDTKFFGKQSYSISGCGLENIKHVETKETIRFWSSRNENNNCQFYKRKWWKFWITNDNK